MNSKEAIQNLLLAQPVSGVAEVCEEDLAVLHALPVTVQIVSYEGTPRNLYANKGALEALGMTNEEFRAQVCAAQTALTLLPSFLLLTP